MIYSVYKPILIREEFLQPPGEQMEKAGTILARVMHADCAAQTVDAQRDRGAYQGDVSR